MYVLLFYVVISDNNIKKTLTIEVKYFATPHPPCAQYNGQIIISFSKKYTLIPFRKYTLIPLYDQSLF